MNTTELMTMGRKQVKETDASLLRSEKIVNDTMAIGIQTAETLQNQTRQLEKVGAGRRRVGAMRGDPQRTRGATCHVVPWRYMSIPHPTYPTQVIDDLDEIHFTMKKARQVIRDITRSYMTDK